MNALKFIKAQSKSADSTEALREISSQFGSEKKAAVVLFCSPSYQLDILGREIKRAFQCPVMCCTTSGEVGPSGYEQHCLVGFCVISDEFDMYVHQIPRLSNFNDDSLTPLTESIKEQHARSQARMPTARAFGFLLIDGLSVKEELVTASLFAALDGLPIVGGSAGDDLKFERTFVYHDGQFVSDAACIGVVVTSHPFEVFKTQHFVPTKMKLVVTGADPEKRIVSSFNGRSAALEYARCVGVAESELRPEVFSCHPVMLKIGGELFVRSIQKRNDDGSLSFYCAIEKGVVLTLGTGVNMLENLEAALVDIETRVNPGIILGCECILRRLEVVDKQIVAAVGEIMARHNVIGFHTYGEQINAVHVNQTFTGVAIGEWA
jgi:hypothetical protein